MNRDPADLKRKLADVTWDLAIMGQNARRVLDENVPEKKEAFMQQLAQGFRITVWEMLHRAGSGHWGGSASAAELLTVLYFHMLRLDPRNPGLPSRDRFVLSKGHAAPMLYAVLAARGFFPAEELFSLRQLNSRLQGHPCMRKVPGVEMSTGALGHGVSVALGMALASPLLREDYWTWVLIGDGDLNEGETWEGFMSAAKFRPRRMVILVDYNRVQLDGPESEIMPTYPLEKRLDAFGIRTCPGIHNGHSVASILKAMEWIRKQDEWPVAVIFQTVKGKGLSFAEHNHKWHGAPVDDATYAKGKPELEGRLLQLTAP